MQLGGQGLGIAAEGDLDVIAHLEEGGPGAEAAIHAFLASAKERRDGLSPATIF
jgi:hypothetical protein